MDTSPFHDQRRAEFRAWLTARIANSGSALRQLAITLYTALVNVVRRVHINCVPITDEAHSPTANVHAFDPAYTDWT